MEALKRTYTIENLLLSAPQTRRWLRIIEKLMQQIENGTVNPRAITQAQLDAVKTEVR